MSNPKRPRRACRTCGKETKRPMYFYCSNVCQMEYQAVEYMKKWKAGEVSGLTSTGTVNHPIKRYLREKFGNKCYLCGWSEINPKTGRVPLVADHIDGNWRNNSESNLRLVCPNCDSLSPTYGALNKGNGRENRAVSKRTREAQALLE
jgi:endogenous inhibitor of DNA gyrase (YacG/DUF329 family)